MKKFLNILLTVASIALFVVSIVGGVYCSMALTLLVPAFVLAISPVTALIKKAIKSKYNKL